MASAEWRIFVGREAYGRAVRQMWATRSLANAGGMTTKARAWAGYAGFGWSLLYLFVAHFPSLIVGRWWLLPIDPQGDPPVFQLRIIESGVCMLLIGCALTSLALVRPWGRVFPRWMLLGVAWVGCAVGVLHWLIWTAESVRRLLGIDHVPTPAGVSDQVFQHYVTTYDLINTFALEPWFLGMGLFLGIAAVQNIRRRQAAVPPPGWLTVNGWPEYVAGGWAALTVVVHTMWAAGSRVGIDLGPYAPADQQAAIAGLWPYHVSFGLLVTVLGGLVAVMIMRPVSRPYAVALRGAAGLLTLGGLLVVLVGIMSFNPWMFGLYGPWLMAGGILADLSWWAGRRAAR